MATEIFKLFGSVFVDNEEANKSIRNTGKESEELQNKMGDAFGKIGNFAATVAKAIVAFSVTVGGAMLATATRTAEYADEIDKLSERTGINREELQRWKYAAGQSGADISKLEVGMKKLTDAMDGATNGSKSQIAAFQELGISISDLQSMSQEEIFEKVMTELSEMEQGAKRNALGNDLLGKSYTELLPLLNAGADGMQALKDRADELGLVMSEDAVKAGVVLGDTMADVQQSFGFLGLTIGSKVMPMIQKFLDYILKNMPEIQKNFYNFADGLQSVFEFLANNVFPIVVDALTWLVDNLPIIIPLVIALGTAMGVFSIVSTIIGLVEAFKAWKLATEGVSIAQAALNLVMSANPIGIVIAAVAALTAGLTALFFTNEEFRDAVLDTWQKIQDFVIAIIENVMMWLSNLWEKIKPFVDFLLPLLLSAFTNTFNGIIAITSFVLSALKIQIDTIISVFNNLIDFIKNVFTENWQGAWKNIANIFGAIFEGIKEMFKAPINWIIDGINKFTASLGALEVPDWVPGIGGKSFSLPQIPRLKIGMDYVPFDDFPALLHKGETVLTAQESENYRKGNTGGTTSNNFNIATLVVREEADVQRIARELFKMQESEQRRRGMA